VRRTAQVLVQEAPGWNGLNRVSGFAMLGPLLWNGTLTWRSPAGERIRLASEWLDGHADPDGPHVKSTVNGGLEQCTGFPRHPSRSSAEGSVYEAGRIPPDSVPGRNSFS
jgi:hypothetical protein